jgi:glutaredoxin
VPLLAALALLLLAAPAAAEMYKIVGTDGKVTYADRPPAEGAAKSVSEFKATSYAGPPEVGTAAPNWEAILRRPIAGLAAAPRSGVVMYSTENCRFCRQAKQYMAGKGMAYSEVDIDKDARGREEYKRLGGRGVPFFIAGGSTLTGFSEGAFEQWLKSRR